MSNPSVSKKHQATLMRRFVTRATRFSAALIIIATIAMALLVTSFASSSFRSPDRRSDSASKSNPATKDKTVRSERKFSGPVDELLEGGNTVAPSLFSALLLPTPPLPGTETITLYAADCTTLKSSFKLGDTVCAVVSGGPDLSIIKRRLAVGDSNELIRDIVDADTNANLGTAVSIATDPQTLKFKLPSLSTSTVGGQSVSNLGVWRINSIHPSRFSVRNSAFFSVSDPDHLAFNLAVYNNDDSGGTVTAGSNVLYTLWITNYGPDAAANVTLTNATPANTTFLSGNDGGLDCTFPSAGGTGTTTCALASLAQGASAKVTLVLNVDSGTSAGTVISSTATIGADSSNTAETYTLDDTSVSNIAIVAGAPETTCTLQCPVNINTAANTTEGSQRGAHVTFPNPSAIGDCGTSFTATPLSGSFFPVGTTTVSITSETGDGVCSFTVTVVDTGSDPPTISCPADKTANADSSCSATVVLGTPSVSGNNVTVVGSRSDGLPMYDCDVNGENCLRKSQDLPFSAGTTTVTWTATSHDSPGPWLDGEEKHTTGTASCTQTVTVNDVTPPTITATDQTVSADASCQATVPDYKNSATDNCACASSDTSEVCQNRNDIIVTQDVAAGTPVGLGPHTITLTATDEANNTTTKTITFTVVDTTPPVISCPSNITVYLPLNTTATSMAVSYPAATATDNCGTPTITYSKASGSVFNVGTTSVTATADDGRGNTASCTFTVTVFYDFTGFFSPVANTPTLNVVNAGRAIPVKFSLSGNKGLGIFAANSPQSGVIPCDASAPAQDLTGTVTAGGSSLSYDASSDQYIYIWKTESSWAGTCRQLVVTLNDGSPHVANFKFR